jgi:hypothetical protein
VGTFNSQREEGDEGKEELDELENEGKVRGYEGSDASPFPRRAF